MTLLHKDLAPEEIHSPFSFFFEDASQRENWPVISEDRWKFAVQTDNNSIWFLVSTLPPVWINVLLFGSRSLPTGPAGGSLSGTYPNPIVLDNSHSHTPGVTLPAYPTTLPPNGPVGGDLTGTYPNPRLPTITGLVAGTYTRATITVDNKGRITTASSNSESPPTPTNGGEVNFNNVILTGNPTAPTQPYGNVSTRIANTNFVAHSVQRESLSIGTVLTIGYGFQKVVKSGYELQGILKVQGRFYVEGSTPPSSGSELSYVPSSRPLTIPPLHQKIVAGPYSLKASVYIQGLLRVI